MKVNDKQNKYGVPREANERVNQWTKTMGRVDYEIHGEIQNVETKK